MDNFENLENLEKLRNRLLNLQETFSSETGEVDYDDILKEMDIDLEEIEQQMVESNGKLDLPYQILHPDAVHPKYNYGSDSGFDLHSVEDIVIPPFGRALVPSGLSFDIKDGFEIQVRTKSGLAINQGLMVLNSPGTVDNGYTGEVKGIIFNTNPTEVKIPKGMKFGQAVVCPVVNGAWVDLNQVNEINKKERGANGFGSTGLV
jgi:dUTP pyrophosphatase